jgi:hypothetical protein
MYIANLCMTRSATGGSAVHRGIATLVLALLFATAGAAAAAQVRSTIVGARSASCAHAVSWQSARRIIWLENRARFGRPETRYRGKNICVHGYVSSYRGTPQVEASSPAQIALAR